jgi:hypothetical protein
MEPAAANAGTALASGENLTLRSNTSGPAQGFGAGRFFLTAKPIGFPPVTDHDRRTTPHKAGEQEETPNAKNNDDPTKEDIDKSSCSGSGV